MLETVHTVPLPFDLVVMAASLGGVRALRTLLAQVPEDFPLPILIVQHLSDRLPSLLTDTLGRRSQLPVRWITDGQGMEEPGVWVAPPGYHVSITQTGALTLSQTARINFVRPSADVLFQSAADRCGDRLLAVILTGSGRDGTAGAVAIKRARGRVLVQNLKTCRAIGMPASAIRARSVDLVLPLTVLAPALVSLVMVPGAADLLRVPADLGDQQPAGMRAVDWNSSFRVLGFPSVRSLSS
jgi:two-component system chemotaxis response regulator CheB